MADFTSFNLGAGHHFWCVWARELGGPSFRGRAPIIWGDGPGFYFPIFLLSTNEKHPREGRPFLARARNSLVFTFQLFNHCGDLRFAQVLLSFCFGFISSWPEGPASKSKKTGHSWPVFLRYLAFFFFGKKRAF